MRQCWQVGLVVLLFATALDCASHGQAASPPKLSEVDLASAQNVAYCEIINKPETFRNNAIRVRALYETDFERAALTAPSCYTPIPMTWVEFDESCEPHTRWRLRHALSSQKWGVQMDVVFIGVFKARGSYGHMGMYPFLFEVYKVEAVRPSGNFRPLPESKH